MTIGLIVMHWDKRQGSELLGQYPPELVVPDKSLMQIYSQHEYSGEPGTVTLQSGGLNIVSYFTGPETAIYLILLLTADEESDVFEEGLADISRSVVANAEDNEVLQKILPSLFQRLSVYPSLNEEQRYAMVLDNDVKRMIIERLREDMCISKSELIVWLRDKYRDGFIDFENIISSLIQMGIMKISSVKGISSDVLFLVGDIMAVNRPPFKNYSNPTEHHLPESLVSSYRGEVKSFFASYKFENLNCLEIIRDVILTPQSYEILKLLREAIVTRNDLEKLKKKGVDNVDEALKALWKNKMIAVFKDDKNTEYFCLLSDVYINKYYPRYNLNNIARMYRNRSQNVALLVKALDMMKEEYYFSDRQIKLHTKRKINKIKSIPD